MVSITVSLKGKAPIKLDFAGKQANDVTIKEVKTAVQAKFPKVGLLFCTNTRNPSRARS